MTKMTGYDNILVTRLVTEGLDHANTQNFVGVTTCGHVVPYAVHRGGDCLGPGLAGSVMFKCGYSN